MRLARRRFSALQRAEIAEIDDIVHATIRLAAVSVLFNEPKLLKFDASDAIALSVTCFSALQRAEIAEM